MIVVVRNLLHFPFLCRPLLAMLSILAGGRAGPSAAHWLLAWLVVVGPVRPRLARRSPMVLIPLFITNFFAWIGWARSGCHMIVTLHLAHAYCTTPVFVTAAAAGEPDWPNVDSCFLPCVGAALFSTFPRFGIWVG